MNRAAILTTRNMAGFAALGLLVVFLSWSVYADPNEARLLSDLLAGYEGKLVRPVKKTTDNVTVTLGMSLISFNLDTKSQLLESQIWLNMAWKDYGMRWDPKDYGGVSSINLRPSDIWTPDITLYNIAGKWTEDRERSLVVQPDGSVLWVPMYSVKSFCPSVKSDNPYRSCPLRFGSWTHSGLQVDLKLNADTVDGSSLIPVDRYWKIVSAPAKRHEMVYDCCPEPYIDVVFTLKLKSTRRSNGTN